MGYLYEELIRRFSELSNETAGEHFTPREVIRLMVNLLFAEDADVLTKPGIIRTIFDPACGTGGMLSVAEDYLRQLNPAAGLEVYGQELNDETYAICRSDMMLKGQEASNIAVGNSLSEDGHSGRTFDYSLANPPFGVEWKKIEDEVRGEHEKLGFRGRFGAGLPRINDGSFLFLQHMISKMKPVEEGGSRIAIVFNGSPLFNGAAGSGESEIRRWIIENDWLDAVVALPDQLFYNTGISTYFWIVTNRKSPARRGKVQLIDVRELFVKMRKSLGEKRKEISDEQIAEVTRLYDAFTEGDRVKIFPNEAFGYMRITVERPLFQTWRLSPGALASLEKARAWKKWQEEGHPVTADELFGPAGPYRALWGNGWPDAKTMLRDLAAAAGADVPAEVLRELVKQSAESDPSGTPQAARGGAPLPDSSLRDAENVPLPPGPVAWEPDPSDRLGTAPFVQAIEAYVAAEVLPYVPDAWVDLGKTKLGYEIPLTRHFYRYVPPRPLAEIDGEIKQLEAEIQALLGEVTE